MSTETPLPAGRLLAKRPRPALAKKRVLLVTPPSIFLLDERVFVNLGILKVAAVLEREGHAVELLDLSGVENHLDALADHLASSKAEAVGITATTPQLPAVAKIVAEVRRVRPTLRIILGGPHPTLVHAGMRQEKKRGMVGRAHQALAALRSMVDVLVVGDGEEAIFEALADDAPWLVDGDDPKTDLFMTHAAYEASPMPARHLIDMASYRYEIEGHRACSAIFQLGCPFRCSFCGGRSSSMLRRIRTRTTASIVAELEFLHREYGYTGFMAYDDELNVNKSIVELMDEISALQERIGVEFRLRGFIKSELFTDEQARAMRRAGFRWLLCGFEAANPRILENIEKQATLEDNERVMEIAARHDLKVKALMSVGHAGESAESIGDVRDWLLKVRPADFDCTVITVFPGTPYYDEAVPSAEREGVWTFTARRSGDRLHSMDLDYAKTAEYYKGTPGSYESYVFTDHLRPEEIVRLRDEVESTVRAKLGIPFNAGSPATRYEHSMGMSQLPPFILRTTAA
jgi:anaerobic magnesium-protoporphyrin IX monomethyl ester cyclase